MRTGVGTGIRKKFAEAISVTVRGKLTLYYSTVARTTNYSFQIASVLEFMSLFNSMTPNDYYRGRTAPLTSKVAFYIFIQQI